MLPQQGPRNGRRNAIAPDGSNHYWQTLASLNALQEHAQGSQNAFVSNHARQVSGRSELSVTSSGTEHSLWRDPDLEDHL